MGTQRERAPQLHPPNKKIKGCNLWEPRVAVAALTQITRLSFSNEIIFPIDSTIFVYTHSDQFDYL